MSGNNRGETRPENLDPILHDLTQRGVKFDRIDGVFRYCDEHNVLTPDEETGLAVWRAGLPDFLRRQRGLCISCAGTPAKAVCLNVGPKLRAKYLPLWCAPCQHSGKWREGL